MISVFLVDDHEVVRRGVGDLIEEEEDLTVVGHAGTVAQALARIPATRPDVAVLDMRLPDGNGVELCRELRSRDPELQCLIFTSYTDEQAMLDAIMAGASGYLIKDVKGMDLVSAVRRVADGQSMLDPRAAAAVMEKVRARTTRPGPLASLSSQERAVLELIGEGLTNRQIGERLFLAEKTVKNYVSSVLSKLGLHRRTQVAVLATELRERQHDADRWR